MNFVIKKPSPLPAILSALFAIALALLLRYAEIIDLRPMHSDEAVQAFKVGAMLAGDIFRYDPTDFHGPVLYYLTFWLCKITGIGSFADMTEGIVRSVPAVIGAIGCGTIPLAFFGRRALPVLLAGTFLAVSAFMIFYSGYFIQETLLVVFAWTAAGIFFFRRKTILNTMLAGIFAGLAIASKETSILIAIIFITAYFAMTAFSSRIGATHKKASIRSLISRLIIFFVPAIFVSTAFYSSFGKNPAGTLDFLYSFPNYISRIGTPLHLITTNTQLQQIASFVMAVLVCLLPIIFIFLIRKAAVIKCHRVLSEGDQMIVFFAVSTVMLTIANSLMMGKTPWLFLGIIPGISLIVAECLANRIKNSSKRFFYCALAVALVAFYSLSTDQHTPTSQRVPAIAEIAEKSKADFIANGGEEKDFFVAIVSDEYWPLPWYLRHNRVGYWRGDEIAPFEFAPIVICEFETWEKLPETITQNFTPLYEFGLRPGIILKAIKRIPNSQLKTAER